MITEGRIRLRAIERADLPLCVTWFNDVDVRRNLQICIPISSLDEERWFDMVMAKPVEEHPLIIETKVADNWVVIGDTSFFDFNRFDQCAEIGIVIGDKQFWNQGIGTEVMRLMVKYGFNTLNLHRIYLRVFETNPRGIRAYEKAGFVLEGRMRKAHYLEGKYVDVLLMSVIKDEWDK